MLRKLEHSIRRGWVSAKHHATNLYHTGRGVLKKVDYSVDLFRRLHKSLTPALADYPEAQKQIKRALTSYDQVKNQAIGAHSVAEGIVSNVRQRVPELGI